MKTMYKRKHLVINDSYKQLVSESYEILQGYLSRAPERTVRVRIKDKAGTICIMRNNQNAKNAEFAYRIPHSDAVGLLGLCAPPIIEKTRHIVTYHNFEWVIDEFHGDLQGLTLAELNTHIEDANYELPPFVGLDVTNDPRYINSNLGVDLYKEN